MAEEVKKGKGSKRIAHFFRELKSEVKKIVWPTKEQVINNTIVVLVVMLIVGAFIAGLDFGTSQLMRLFFSQFGGS